MSRRMMLMIGLVLVMMAGGAWLRSNGYVNFLGPAMLLLCIVPHLLLHGGHRRRAARDPAQPSADGGKQSDRSDSCH